MNLGCPIFSVIQRWPRAAPPSKEAAQAPGPTAHLAPGHLAVVFFVTSLSNRQMGLSSRISPALPYPKF